MVSKSDAEKIAAAAKADDAEYEEAARGARAARREIGIVLRVQSAAFDLLGQSSRTFTLPPGPLSRKQRREVMRWFGRALELAVNGGQCP